MRTLRQILTTAAAAVAMSALAVGPAMAHGGSVSPPADQRSCSNLDLNDRGEATNAEGGLSDAGEHSATVTWDHCPE